MSVGVPERGAAPEPPVREGAAPDSPVREEAAPDSPVRDEAPQEQSAESSTPRRRPKLETVMSVVNVVLAVFTFGATVYVGFVANEVQSRANDIQEETVGRQRSRDYFDMRVQAAEVSFVRNGPTGPGAGQAVITNRSPDPLPRWGLIYQQGHVRHLLPSHTSVRACAAYRVDDRSAAAAAARVGGGSMKLQGFYFADRYGRYWERSMGGSITDIDDGKPPRGSMTTIDPNAFVRLEPGTDRCGDDGSG